MTQSRVAFAGGNGAKPVASGMTSVLACAALALCSSTTSGASAQACAGVEAAWLGEARASDTEQALHAALDGAQECLGSARLRYHGPLRIALTLTTDAHGRVQAVEPLVADTTPRRGLYACVAPALRAVQLEHRSASLSLWVQHVATRGSAQSCPRPEPPTRVAHDVRLEILEGESERLESTLGSMRRSWSCSAARHASGDEQTGQVVGTFTVRSGFGLTESVQLEGPPRLVACARRWIDQSRFRSMMGDERRIDARVEVRIAHRVVPLPPSPMRSRR